MRDFMNQSNMLSSRYEAKNIEETIYEFWESQGFFQASSSKPSFCIMLPPPNVTGSLHLGHALDHTIQDVLVRWKRMLGLNTLWQPGLDHAGIATQSVVERHIYKQGQDPKQIGREKFLKQAWSWKDKYAQRITQQMKRLGDSCDWKKSRFTLDEGLSQAVKKVFVTLYKEGLIYRGQKLVNWDTKLESAVSDLEVEHQESDGFLWHIRYALLDHPETYLVVATTRPETLLGDTALCVHPEDQRYRQSIGQKAKHPLLSRHLPIISDEFVDRDFGSGVVKITPAHDFTDYEVGQRHNLEMLNILNPDGTLHPNTEKYQGLTVQQARKKVLEDLDQLGLLVKQEPYKITVPVSQRSGQVIEPFLSEQWFVKSSYLAKQAKLAVENKDMSFEPELWTNTYLHWMNNIQDWCISRQLWWGHRIPAWFCRNCDQVSVSTSDLKACHHCQSLQIYQDKDVLDTWFSSALWPFSTLGWPEETPELKTFYPTDVLVTGHDIIFFWVGRMMMMGLHYLKEVPFKKVYIHGIVRDKHGKKMSKSLGNTLDPIELIDEYGADALRFALIWQTTGGRDLKFSKDDLQMSRNFLNKIWNAARFALSCIQESNVKSFDLKDLKDVQLPDQWIIFKLGHLEKSVHQKLEKFRFSEMASLLYAFVWNDFCDWYLEFIKPIVYDKDPLKKQSTLVALAYVLNRISRLLHPVIPFLTEEIYQKLPMKNQACVIDAFPNFENDREFLKWGCQQAAFEMDVIREVITAIRNIRGENRIALHQPIDVKIIMEKGDYQDRLEVHKDFILKLAKVKSCEITTDKLSLSKVAVSLLQIEDTRLRVVVPLEGLVDLDKEIKRIEKNLHKVQEDIQKLNGRLNNPDFVKNAPDRVVAEHKSQLQHLQAKHKSLTESLKHLS